MTRRIITPLAVGVALMLLVAGCGSDDDNTALIESGAVDDTERPAEPSPNEDPTDRDEPQPSPEPTRVETQPEAPEDAGGAMLLIMDASGSMNRADSDGQTLIAGAKHALIDVVERLPDEQHVGLRVYGHRYPNTDRENGCTDTELIHPVEPLDRGAMINTINGYEAKGYTPIGLSLEEGAKDLPPEGERTMVLVSDGEETCDTDPCAAAKRAREEGIDLIIHTVGFALGGNDAARSQLECIADAGGGEFLDVAEAGDLADAIEQVAREDRTFSVSGSELAGAPIPRDANTGNVNTPHTDTVLDSEENYYRFDVEPGTEVRGELVVEAGCGLARVDLTDETGNSFPGGDLAAGGDAPKVVHTDPVVAEDEQLWLEVTTRCQSGDEEFDIEFQVVTVD